MSNYKLRNTGPVLVCIAALGLRTVCGQTSPGLQGWFQALMQGPALVAKPSQDELSALQKRVSAADPDEVHGAIPWMIGALRLNDGGKEHYAFFGLLAAALRSDGPTLLKDRMGDVVSLLTSPGTLAQRGAVFVLGSIQQRQLAPVPGLSQALVSFVKRTDRDLQAQVSAVAFLLSRSEEEMATQDAVEGFLSRDLDADSRTRVLSAIGRGNANPKPARLIDLVTAALDNPDESVRSTAIDMLSLIGPLAVMRAEPSLRKLAEGTGQPEAIRSAARKALKDAGLRVE